MRYRLAIHDVIDFGDQKIIVGEAYYPKYKSNSGYYNPYYYNTQSFGGRSFYENYDRVFDGFQYTHAVIIGLDNRGNVLWDNSFEINDAKSFQLENFVKVCKRENDIVLLYLFDQTIKTKIIKGNEVLFGKKEIDILLPNENDIIKIKYDEYEGLKKWFGENTFYAYGIQKIKNLKDDDVPLNRKVFFINKIVVEQ